MFRLAMAKFAKPLTFTVNSGMKENKQEATEL